MPESPVVIPEYITVHLGRPDNPNAQNVTVPFIDYIKNVASSEIYPTWPETSIRANVYAQISFALNRIFTEFYRSRGYDFDITNSTAYDQYFVYGRDIFGNINDIVDEIFNNYVIKQGSIEPYFTAYCNGTTVTCEGLSQWGTVSLANQGLTPYQILQRYYGNDIDIVRNAPVGPNIPSYPGVPLRLGTVSEDVRTIQRELNRIARNYPAIPRINVGSGFYDLQTQEAVIAFQNIFNLNPDGIVGKETWYKIKQIYNGVKNLNELYSEGLKYSEISRIYERILSEGSRGTGVELVQFYLRVLNYFNPEIPLVSLDGIFGPATKAAVEAFQRAEGLTVDGIVGRNTWNALQAAYTRTIQSISPQYNNYEGQLYPGYALVIGSTGNYVAAIQRYINAIAAVDPAIPSVTVDGIYGQNTAAAVRAIQQQAGLNVTGYVSWPTWRRIVTLYNDIVDGNA